MPRPPAKRGNGLPADDLQGDLSDLPAREKRPGEAVEDALANGNGASHKSESDPQAGSGKQDSELKGKPKSRRKALIIGGIILVVVAASGVLYWLHERNFATTDDAFVEGHVIAISPQVSAKVAKIYVRDNQIVKAGDPLVDLDPTDYEVALQQAKAAEAAARGKLSQSKAQVVAAEAGVKEADTAVQMADVSFRNVDADLKRYEALDERARSKQQYENAITAQKTAAMQVDTAKARRATAAAQSETAAAAVATAQGDLEKAASDVRHAEVNLGYCKIVAPADGRITRKNAEPGSYVTPSQALMAVVPPHVWVVANYKETQLEDMRVGQAVTISVDAFGGKDFTGKIDSIQAGTGSRFSLLPAENATGNFVKVVQRIPVKISIDNEDPGDGRFLSPGMSVVVKTRVK